MGDDETREKIEFERSERKHVIVISATVMHRLWRMLRSYTFGIFFSFVFVVAVNDLECTKKIRMIRETFNLLVTN